MRALTWRKIAIYSLASVVWACGDDGKSAVEEVENRDLVGGNGNFGDVDPCAHYYFVPVGWDEALSIGVSASEVFSRAAGTCNTILSWDVNALEGASPIVGESGVTVVLNLDTHSVESQRTSPGGDAVDSCDELELRIRGTAAIFSTDGMFNKTEEVFLFYTSHNGSLSTLTLTQELASMHGRFQLPVETDETAYLNYDFQPPGIECAGRISLSVWQSEGEETHVTPKGIIGTWSGSKGDEVE